MFKRAAAGLLLALGIGLSAHAQQSQGISSHTAVCNPKFQNQCVQPDSSGAIPITGSITATNPSVGTNNATAPTSSTQIGILDGGGKLQPASATNPVPVTGSFASGYTAAASPTAVSAGTNKPGFIDTANSAQYFEPVKPGTTTTIDLSAPSGVLGTNGSSIAAPGNPFDVELNGAIPAGSNIIGKVGIDQTTPGTTNAISLGQIGSTTVLTGGVAGSLGTGGLAANNATASGNPVPHSCIAVNVEATLATNGQNAECVTDLAHKQIVAPYANPENLVQGTTAAMTGTTSTSLLGVPGSGLHNYVTNLTCVNSHATVGTFVTVQDGSGGTALYTLAAAAVFGGSTITFPAPLRQPTANTALYVADVTTGANVICSASGYKGQ